MKIQSQIKNRIFRSKKAIKTKNSIFEKFYKRNFYNSIKTEHIDSERSFENSTNSLIIHDWKNQWDSRSDWKLIIIYIFMCHHFDHGSKNLCDEEMLRKSFLIKIEIKRSRQKKERLCVVVQFIRPFSVYSRTNKFINHSNPISD